MPARLRARRQSCTRCSAALCAGIRAGRSAGIWSTHCQLSSNKSEEVENNAPTDGTAPHALLPPAPAGLLVAGRVALAFDPVRLPQPTPTKRILSFFFSCFPAGDPKNYADTCQGDSGGALFAKGRLASEDVVFGLTSYGSGCADGYPSAHRVWVGHRACTPSPRQQAAPRDLSRAVWEPDRGAPEG